ncbi:MAG: ATP synthase F1 subunit epsilon [Candidatus Auribacterota bacterium]|jgi:F-type H+-transporting ATPase subunit epsilon|nr:ATP synthase F1 subunit epsilon [Candidatus Auribacterota bacterium]
MSMLQVEIMTPDRKVAGFECEKVVVYGEDGFFTILPGHAKLISNVRISELVCSGISTPSGEKEPVGSYFVSGGFVKIEKDSVQFFTPSAERGDRIDLDRAEQARKRAVTVTQTATGGIDFDRAQAALERALVRLRIGQKFGRKPQ